MSRRTVAALAVARGAVLALALGGLATGCTRPAAAPRESPVAALFAARAHGVWIECRGTVVRVLPDDTRPPRHERFLVRVAGAGADQTVLVAHNIDLAPRAPVAPGDTVDLRGEYEWNAQGGVVHETHHATSTHATGSGWVRVRGATYQ